MNLTKYTTENSVQISQINSSIHISYVFEINIHHTSIALNAAFIKLLTCLNLVISEGLLPSLIITKFQVHSEK